MAGRGQAPQGLENRLAVGFGTEVAAGLRPVAQQAARPVDPRLRQGMGLKHFQASRISGSLFQDQQDPEHARRVVADGLQVPQCQFVGLNLLTASESQQVQLAAIPAQDAGPLAAGGFGDDLDAVLGRGSAAWTGSSAG